MEGEEEEIFGGSEGEMRGLNDTVGNEEINYNGHGERKESTKLAETVKSLQKEVQSYKEDNNRMLQQLNDMLVHNLNEIQRQMNPYFRKRKESQKEKKHARSVSKSKKPRYSSPSSGGSSNFSKESRSIPERTSGKIRRRRHRRDELQGELKKIKPPIFKGDSEKGEYVEAWLLGLRKYFRIYNYSSRMEASIAIHQL